jgi:hypothetical protein
MTTDRQCMTRPMGSARVPCLHWTLLESDGRLTITGTLSPLRNAAGSIVIAFIGVAVSALLWWANDRAFYTPLIIGALAVVISMIGYLIAMLRVSPAGSQIVLDESRGVLTVTATGLELPVKSIAMLQLMTSLSYSGNSASCVTELNLVARGEPAERYNLISRGSKRHLNGICCALARRLDVPVHFVSPNFFMYMTNKEEIRHVE